VRIDPLISGGGQERGLRSGTLPPPLAIGMGEAARICMEEMEVSPSLIIHSSHDYKNAQHAWLSYALVGSQARLSTRRW
jgi:cysteine sulfinate desulfinase/cysteine desulfurase-like protein